MQIYVQGLVPYQEALRYQQELCEKRRLNEIEDTILLLEHPAVITQGRRATDDDILATTADLKRNKVEIYRIPRGGETTYHGPGQLIGYFILRLPQVRRVAALIHGVEDAIMALLAQYTISASRRAQQPGVWVGEKKIAAVGFAIQHGVTSHGFSLNVAPDLSHYHWIKACGVSANFYTSMAAEINKSSSPELLQNATEKIAPLLQHMYEHYLLSKT